MKKYLDLKDRRQWREWLSKNHDSTKEIWLVYHKRHTGKKSIPYNDSVEEALCFGWVDSTVNRLDEDHYARKFTPRKSKSVWSELNKKRARKMIKEGRMTERGLARIEDAKRSGEWTRSAEVRKGLVVPAFVKNALRGYKRARDNFKRLAPSHKRQYIGWITAAKKEETKKRRLEEMIRNLERNKKLGMK